MDVTGVHVQTVLELGGRSPPLVPLLACAGPPLLVSGELQSLGPFFRYPRQCSAVVRSLPVRQFWGGEGWGVADVGEGGTQGEGLRRGWGGGPVYWRRCVCVCVSVNACVCLNHSGRALECCCWNVQVIVWLVCLLQIGRASCREGV